MTEEERKAAEARQRALLQAQQEEALGGLGGFMQSIIEAIEGFFKFLFQAFSGETVGDGDGREIEQPATPTQPSGMVQLFNGIKASAASTRAWANYQQEHQGKAVSHRNPIAGVATVGDDRHMRENHPITHDRRMHHGVDFPRSKSSSTDIVASADGVVLYSGLLRGYGQTVMIGHADGSYSLYAHLTGAHMPEVATTMKQGQKIGVMGQTGGADGIHLHYEQRKGSESVVPVIEGKLAVRGLRLGGEGLPNLAHLGVRSGDAPASRAPFAQVASIKAASAGHYH